MAHPSRGEMLLLQILKGGTLSDKLAGREFSFQDLDWSNMAALTEVIESPGRTEELKPRESEKSHFPKKSELKDPKARGVLLHHFANHELLAIETMAYALLKFPEADVQFRAGLFRTLQDEQKHLGLYVERMEELGVKFGSLPLNIFFWTTLHQMKSPLEFVTQMSLTFEQANLDFAKEYAEYFRKDGLDEKTASILQIVHDDEVQHVAHGLKWFQVWRPEFTKVEDDFLAYAKLLPYPLTPRRARGNQLFSEKSRLDAGMSEAFIENVRIAGGSRGKVPRYFFFNPECEIEALVPTLPESIRVKIHDVAPLMLWLADEEDVVELKPRPPLSFLTELHQLKGALPEVIESFDDSARYVAFDELKPWGYGESAWKKFDQFSGKVRKPPAFSRDLHRKKLFSKTYWREFLRESEAEPKDTQEVLLKSDQSTSGRGHQRIPRDLLNEPAFQKKLEDRVKRGDRYLIEPFYNKIHDFSVQYEIFADGRVKEFDPRFFTVDDHFQYQASYLGRNFKSTSFEESSAFLDREKLTVKKDHARVIDHLKELNYTGPVGIDAFIYRDSFHALKIRSIVEVNARYTMGRIAIEIEKALIRTRGESKGIFRFINTNDLVAHGCRNFKELEQKLKEKWGERFIATTPSSAIQTWTYLTVVSPD